MKTGLRWMTGRRRNHVGSARRNVGQSPDICGGRIRIDGTRITVHRIATLYKQGQSPEDIAQTYPHLSLSQVYAALAYYHANRAESNRH